MVCSDATCIPRASIINSSYKKYFVDGKWLVQTNHQAYAHVCNAVPLVCLTINTALVSCNYYYKQVLFPDHIRMRHALLLLDIVCLAKSELSHQHFTLCRLLWESEGTSPLIPPPSILPQSTHTHTAAAFGLLKKKSRMFSMGGNNAFLEFFLEGIPDIVETHLDSKKVGGE